MKLYDIGLYLVYIAMYSVTIPVAVGIYNLRSLSKPLSILLAGLCVVLFLDLLLLFFDNRTANILLYFFTAVDVLAMSLFFIYPSVKKSRYRYTR